MEAVIIAALPNLISLVTHGIEAIERSVALGRVEKAKQLIQLKRQLDELQDRLYVTTERVNAVTFDAQPPKPTPTHG